MKRQITVTWPGSTAVLKDIWGLASSLAPNIWCCNFTIGERIQPRCPGEGCLRHSWKGEWGREGCMVMWPLQGRHKQVPNPRGVQESSEAAGGVRDTHHAERGSKWCFSVLKLKRKQGANSFCDNYQILEMDCSLPTPRTLPGAPAVLIMYVHHLRGQKYYSTTKALHLYLFLFSINTWNLVYLGFLGTLCFVWKLRGMKKKIYS